jgi:SAM-dependent methyltransferase
MIPQENKRIKLVPVPELEADHEDYFRVVEDMIRNGGTLIPDPNWLMLVEGAKKVNDKQAGLDFALSEDAYRRQFSRMTNLMPAWIGASAAEAPSPHTVARYRRFLEYGDPLDLWQSNVTQRRSEIPMLQADLGSIMDLNLLYIFADSSRRKMTRILEVGGGYGRLAEAAFNIFGRSIKYVLVDAVPGSLYYARSYLSHACPEARIISYYDDGGYEGLDLDSDDFDIAVVPSWHFERINKSAYDICVNIESMQEMNQVHVDYYLRLFQSVAAEDAAIYISNARDYYFRGTFNYPPNWRKLFASNTPRSWKPCHPTEVFRKTNADCSMQNNIVDAAYNYGLWLQRDPAEFMSRNGCKDVIAPLSKGLVQALKWRWRGIFRPVSASEGT